MRTLHHILFFLLAAIFSIIASTAHYNKFTHTCELQCVERQVDAVAERIERLNVELWMARFAEYERLRAAREGTEDSDDSHGVNIYRRDWNCDAFQSPVPNKGSDISVICAVEIFQYLSESCFIYLTAPGKEGMFDASLPKIAKNCHVHIFGSGVEYHNTSVEHNMEKPSEVNVFRHEWKLLETGKRSVADALNELGHVNTRLTLLRVLDEENVLQMLKEFFNSGVQFEQLILRLNVAQMNDDSTKEMFVWLRKLGYWLYHNERCYVTSCYEFGFISRPYAKLATKLQLGMLEELKELN